MNALKWSRVRQTTSAWERGRKLKVNYKMNGVLDEYRYEWGCRFVGCLMSYLKNHISLKGFLGSQTNVSWLIQSSVTTVCLLFLWSCGFYKHLSQHFWTYLKRWQRSGLILGEPKSPKLIALKQNSSVVKASFDVNHPQIASKNMKRWIGIGWNDVNWNCC